MIVRNILSLAVIICLTAGYADAQCRHYTKKKCMDELADYTGNGQYNGAVMFEGEEATLVQTFYSGQEYRIFVCSQPSISDSLYFEVLDYRKQLMYSSKGEDSDVFDFSVESTQQLRIRAVVPEMSTQTTLKKNGCVSILVGFKN